MFDIGVPELIIVLVILLLLFGAKKLPELAKTMGSSARELRKGFSDPTDSSKKSTDSSNV